MDSPDASTFAPTDVGGVGLLDDVAVEVSVVAAALSAFLGDCL
jgi:hypothetical protein